MISFYVAKTHLELRETESFTSGMVAAVLVQFDFSADWDGLTKVAVFTAGETSVNCVLPPEGRCTIPWECLQIPGQLLKIGVYGTLDGTLVLPTRECQLGYIWEGTKLGSDGSTEGSPSLAEQMILKANEAITVAESVRTDADAGLFHGEQGVQGPAGCVTIGSVASGSSAAVTNSGTGQDAVLDFVLPIGPQGEKGETGAQGEKGETGAKGDPGNMNVTTASLSFAAAAWVGTSSPYQQTVTLPNITANSKVDLQPDATALGQLLEDGTSALFISNNGGTLTAIATGEKPTADLTLQATLLELPTVVQ